MSSGRWILAAVVAALLMLGAGPAGARFVEDEQKAVEAVKKVKPSVVKIETTNPASRTPGIGSGVILRKDGFIITNYHVIKKATEIKVYLPNGKTYMARVWQASKPRDIAILKIAGANLPVPRFGNSDRVELGQMAIAIGSPLRFSWSVTIGTVSAVGRDVSAQNTFYKNLIQTDAAINPGSSGGALVNSSGEVIGINTLVYTGTEKYPHAQGLAFAIPINDALKVAQSLVGHQEVGPPPGGPAWLGIDGKDVTREMADMSDFKVKSGVLVKSVVTNSPAEAGGLRKSDVITAVDGSPVRSLGDLKAIIDGHRSGDKVEIEVWTLGKTKRSVNVTLEPSVR